MKAKTVIITGCTRGLGRAMVPIFIGAGWQVARLRAQSGFRRVRGHEQLAELAAALGRP
jgi:NAD(P)-dependent dehydrogenase (short-subunit alcohol dehydrogenase family)